MLNTMYVVKRNGNSEELSLDKIAKRIRKLALEEPILDKINIMEIVPEVVKNIYNNISTTELDDNAAWLCSCRSIEEPQYESLAVRISVDNNHKNTKSTFSGMMKFIKQSKKITLSDDIYNLVLKNKDTIDAMIINSRDNLFSYFGFKTLDKIYLLQIDGKIIERPQYMWMRTALDIHRDNMEMVKECYDLLSQHYFTHATPTLFNSSLKLNQQSSCMLLTNFEDSIDGIYQTIKDCSVLGARAAGIGLDMTNIRSKGSVIKSTGRPSRGIPAFITIHDVNATVVDQGNKRKMSSAIYLQPWHSDFIDVMEMKSTDNTSPLRARELFYAVWSNNLLYERAKNGEMWSFFCPTETPKLLNTWGDEFRDAYLEYEKNKLYTKQISAQDLYKKLALLMIETGGPYHLNKDECNAKSNMKNVGHINSSNLCAEILIPNGHIDGNYEIGVCTLASINLTKFVDGCVKYDNDGNMLSRPTYDFEQLSNISGNICNNLNNIIDTQYYQLDACKLSSARHRPIGIGIQGLADVFMMMGYAYTSPEAKMLNWQIAEAIYYGAIMKSMELAKRDGPYSTFQGSPASQGKLQPHLWVERGSDKLPYRYDWDNIGMQVQKVGLRNALLIAFMPTASTSQLLDNFSSFEPCHANIFARHTLAGVFNVLNKHLVRDLKSMNIWNIHIKERIIAANGSVQYIREIPQSLRDVYKTVWEIPQKDLLDMSADRGQFICHTQSLNVYFNDPTISKVTSLLMYGMKKKLKTISYYTNSGAAIDPVKFTVSVSEENKAKQDKIDKKTVVCTEDVCTSCSA